MIYVTHDQVEAMILADRVVALEFGEIAQVGAPRELYERPANLFVAQFIGGPKMNVIPCTVPGDQIQLENGGGGPFDRTGTATMLGICPEHISVVEPGSGHSDGTVEVVEYLGAVMFIIVDYGFEEKVTVRLGRDTQIKTGAQIGLYFAHEEQQFFDAAGQTISPGERA